VINRENQQLKDGSLINLGKGYAKVEIIMYNDDFINLLLKKLSEMTAFYII